MDLKELKKEMILLKKKIQKKIEYVHEFKGAVVTEYYVGDNCASTRIGCMGTELKENYSCASHNIPCGTLIYIPSLKGIINKDGIFEVEDTGGMSFDFDIFISSDLKGRIGKVKRDVYVIKWGNKKMTTSYTYIINYFKKQGTFEKYRKSWELYLKLGGQLINFFKFNDEDKNLDKDNV